jgi:aryl-alcohol dehydrogenase-like predicted oxidoreductase
MMESREVGSSGVRLSVVGFGTAQLQMLPERQGRRTLYRRGDPRVGL